MKCFFDKAVYRHRLDAWKVNVDVYERIRSKYGDSQEVWVLGGLSFVVHLTSLCYHQFCYKYRVSMLPLREVKTLLRYSDVR